jgi:hypothetical protein
MLELMVVNVKQKFIHRDRQKVDHLIKTKQHSGEYCSSIISPFHQQNKVFSLHNLAVDYFRQILYTIITYIAISLVNWLHHKYQKMKKVNPEDPNSLQQGIERCIQGCITLHKDIAMTDPYPEIAIKAAETAKQVISAIIDPKTKVVATLPNVPVNVPAASKVNESTSTSGGKSCL